MLATHLTESPTSSADPDMDGHTQPAFIGSTGHLETLLESFPLAVVAAVAIAQLELLDPLRGDEEDEPCEEVTGVRRIVHEHGTARPRLVPKHLEVSR